MRRSVESAKASVQASAEARRAVLLSSLAEVQGGAPEENALALADLLDGKGGAYRNIVLLNAAAAFLVAEKVETLADGVEMGAVAIDSGAARRSLDKLVEITNG